MFNKRILKDVSWMNYTNGFPEGLNGGTSVTLNTCNMKQLNFRHFNTNSKKSLETANFFQKEAKTAPKRPILFCLVYQGFCGHFTTIYVRFPQATEDSRRLPKFFEE